MGDMVESASPVGTALVPVAPELPDRPASDLELPRVEDDYRKVASVGYLIIFVCFGLFGGWSYLAEIDSAAPAPGVVVVESYRKTVQHLEGGIVRDIAVREGDVVVAGDILVRLDDTRARAELELVRGRLYSSLAHEARLIAERDRQSTIEWSPILEWAARIDSRASDAMKLQRQAFAARRAAQQGEAELLRQRIEQLNSKIDGLQAQRTSLLTLELSYRDEVKDFRKLYEEKFSDRPRLRQLERQAAEAAGDAGENQAALAGVYLEIGETRQQILQLEKEFHAEVVDELKVVQTEIFDMQERQRSLEDTVNRTEIRAPVDGVVMGLGIHTVGGVIQPATPVLEIIPQGEPLVIEAQVSPTDIDKVHPGVIADIYFSAFSRRTTPVIMGRVETVSADRVEEQGGGVYYRAMIKVLPDEMEKIPDLTLLPGMPADVMIKTGSRTFLSYIVQPIRDGMVRSFRED